MVKFFKTPFASNGDKLNIPEELQEDGSISFDQGYGEDYEKNRKTDPDAKNISRQSFNGLLHDITDAIGDIQRSGVAKWSDEVTYNKGSLVWHNKSLYSSLLDSNKSQPPSASWTTLLTKESLDLSEYRKKDDNIFNGYLQVRSENEGQGAGVFLQDTDGTVRGQVVATDQGLQLTQYPKDGGLQTFTFPMGGEGGEVALKHEIYVDDFVRLPSETNDTQRFQRALDHGGVIHLTSTKTYIVDELTVTKPTALVGNGASLISKLIRIKSSNFTARNIKMSPPFFATAHRGFSCLANTDNENYENIRIESIDFSGYFYSTNMRAKGYSAPVDDPSNREIKEVEIINCTSVAPSGGVNAGHFQHIGVDTVLIMGCKTYGGQNASSYNFINGNKNIRVIGNYDHNNSYASCEIENNSNNAVVSGNTFNMETWIDDSKNVTITGNTLNGRIFVTAQSNDCENITISGNTVRNISATPFGGNVVGFIKGLTISGNTIIGEEGVGPTSLFLDRRVVSALVVGNYFGSVNSSGHSVGINAPSNAEDIKVINNTLAGGISLSGNVEKVIEYGNDFINSSAKSVHISRMMQANKDWLDLPGYYMMSGEFTGNISKGENKTIVLTIPSISQYAARVIQFTFIARDIVTNSFTSFKIDALVRRTTATSVTVSDKYAKVGALSDDLILNISASSESEIVIDISHSRTSNVQVQVISQVTSQMTERA